MTAQLHLISDTSPASASTAAGSTVVGLGSYDALEIIAELIGATGGTLDVYLQNSTDGGTTWYDWVHYPQLGAGASARKYAIVVPPAGEVAITLVGKNTSPALAANTVIGGPWGDRLRALYVAGGGTSAGAAVVIKILGQTTKR